MVSVGEIRFEVMMVPWTVKLSAASGANTGGGGEVGWLTR